MASGNLKGTEIACTDPESGIIDMPGLSFVVFLVNPREQQEIVPPKNALALLHGGSMHEPIPDCTDVGHPAYGIIYKALKTQHTADRVKGVDHPTQACKFLVRLSKFRTWFPLSEKTPHADTAPFQPTFQAQKETTTLPRKEKGVCLCFGCLRRGLCFGCLRRGGNH